MQHYVIALDQGTTSSRCIIFDENERVVAMAQKETTQLYPKAGWVEQDPMEIYATIYGTMSEALAQGNIAAADIAAIGITNQRETTVLWDKQTGEPVYNAIVWQCRRTAEYCEELKRQGLEPTVRDKTGLLIDGYFPPQRSVGCWTMCPAPGSWPGRDGFYSEQWTHGCCGSSRAAPCTRRITPTHPARCCSISIPCNGMMSC